MVKKVKKNNKAVLEGQCALTHSVGKYVKSHLLPQALTAHEVPGEYFIEAGNGFRPVRRFTSWYDSELVVRAGEDILSDIDSRAINELRRTKLVWSGWGKKKILCCPEHSVDSESKQGFRLISGVDTNVIRLFFLSLLWRALSTKRTEFSHLPKTSVDIDMLRRMILSGDSGLPSYCPIILHQMNSRGVTHNQTPTFQVEPFPATQEHPAYEYKFYRFYMQGLIAHVLIDMDESALSVMSGMCIGSHDKVLVLTRPFNTSAQWEKMKATAKMYSH